MKRLTASRRLKKSCDGCGKRFAKGHVYYRNREVYAIGWANGIAAFEYLLCPKCKWKNEQHKRRHNEFEKRCTHPDKFIETEWSYIPGECVKEPNYDYCRLCGKTF